MTYTEGLVNSVYRQNGPDQYTLIYYSMKRKPEEMPGPSGNGFQKIVLKGSDNDFPLRKKLLNSIVLPEYFSKK